MPFFILSILIQVALVIHVVKTGRNTTWIWIVVMLPVAGSIAYFILEVLPELTNSRAGRNAGRKVGAVINPNKGFNQAAHNFSVSGTVDNTKRLADECMAKGLYSDAKTLYEKCLVGIHAKDPSAMVGLANAEFMLGHYAKTKTLLDDLIASNPNYKNQDAHLLYARTLEALDEVTGALHEYEVLHDYFSGPEASFYYALFLKKQNQKETANEIFSQIINKAKMSGKHYSSLHKDILKRAKNELAAN
ncbi:tetratricopeptide repeat protein [Glaciecola sp. 1036]|uniref:tetratricopeptide repeat protein n=1 Tax=Alteromonadaceae TaxID=72275 RepID=UPI003D00D1B7